VYTTIGNFYVKEGRANEAHAALKELASKVTAEPGTLLYLIHEQLGSLPPAAPRTIVFLEMYTDEKAFQKHLTGPAFKNFVAKYGELFESDPHGNPFITFSRLDRLAGFVREAVVTK
jgi:uncharacterized protein